MARRFDQIRTACLVMRRWRDADRHAYAAMNADPAVMCYFPATLGRAASDASIEELFQRGLDQIWSMTAVRNVSSQAVMRRLGMTPYARFDHPKVEACEEVGQ